MDTKSLEYFIALYRCKNMHKAAEDLFLTQQGLSQAVTRLEKECGAQLFERGPHGGCLKEV
ncbi:MAG: LysR family transcriptional regulator [Eubacteriales bacterium]|nr:LysR family transcriptional regulator [Eubacteriales bacterium]